jgi:hypothetical protein
MSEIFTFNLQKAAKGKGGDKYECATNPEFNMYIPQTVSRPNDATVPLPTFEVTIKKL